MKPVYVQFVQAFTGIVLDLPLPDILSDEVKPLPWTFSKIAGHVWRVEGISHTLIKHCFKPIKYQYGSSTDYYFYTIY